LGALAVQLATSFVAPSVGRPRHERPINDGNERGTFTTSGAGPVSLGGNDLRRAGSKQATDDIASTTGPPQEEPSAKSASRAAVAVSASALMHGNLLFAGGSGWPMLHSADWFSYGGPVPKFKFAINRGSAMFEVWES